jgi:uncharacterized protein (DUF1810 family)
LPLDAGGEDYADWILEQISDWPGYQRLALSAADHAARHLSWDVAGRQIAEILQAVVRERASYAMRRTTEIASA